MSDVEDFQDGNAAGAAEFEPQQMSSFRKNQHILIKGRPCKITDMSTCKTGKHGSAKVNIVAVDIFTGRKYEDSCPSTANKDKPIVTRKEFSLVDISEDGFLSLMNDNGDIKEDIKMPPSASLATEIQEKFKDGADLILTIISACGEEQVVSVRNAAN